MIKCDDEFRLLQATYNYPWIFDYNHLHSIILEPIYQTLPTFRSSPVMGVLFAATLRVQGAKFTA